VSIISVTDQNIERAVQCLSEGGLVGLPTETVYGLAADATNGKAVARIFEAKGRPSFNPLIVHVYDLAAAQTICEFGEKALPVASKFWPGPLTLILKRKSDTIVSELCSAGLETIAIRVPAHPVAQRVLKSCGFPLAAPSANKSGHLSPTTAEHVFNSLGAEVDFIIAAGTCEVGLESTVLDLSEGETRILRPGAVLAEDIERVLEKKVPYDLGHKDAPSSPGQLLRHYAPGIPLRMNAVDLEPGEALLAFGSDKFMGIRGGGAAKDLPDSAKRNLSESSDLYEAASNLFKMLHELDCREHKVIAVMSIPSQGLGIAINDRLKRAQAAHEEDEVTV
jgi:L-threonylcarbamoyladenylate synthase